MNEEIIDKYIQLEYELTYLQKIYILHSPTTGLYKIGISQDVKKRIQSLRAAGGIKVKRVAVGTCEKNHDLEPKLLERKLHESFKHKRKKGEWFELNDDDVKSIVEMLHSECSWNLYVFPPYSNLFQ